MRTSENIDKIAPAIIAARKEMKAIGKSGNNTFDKYRYANLLDYIEGTEKAMLGNGLMLITGNPAIDMPEKRTTQKGGNEYPVTARLTCRLVHESGQWIEIDAHGQGQDRGDKGLYKAITGGRKYVIACLFGLATTDDPERDDDDGNGRLPPPAQRPTAPKAAPMSEIKNALRDAVTEWGKLKPEQVPKAVKACAERAGVKLKAGVPMTDQEAEKVYAWVMEQCAADKAIEEVLA